MPADPAALRLTPLIVAQVGEIDAFKGAWQALGRIAPNRLSALRRAAAIESVAASVRLAGGALTDHEAAGLLTAPGGTLTSRDAQEAAGYAEVANAVFDGHAAMPLTESRIRQLHRDLLAHSPRDARHAGSWKSRPNPIQAFDDEGMSLGVVFETAAPADTPALMGELVEWLAAREREQDLHPLLVTALFTATFLEIHPFQDGNGRMSRILTLLALLRAGYGYVPYASLERVIEEDRDAHDKALRQAQETVRSPAPEWTAWIERFLEGLLQQKRRLEGLLERERTVVAELPALSGLILDLLRQHGRVTVAQAAAASGASRHTVKDHLKALVANGHLVLHGAGRGAWYGPA